MCMDHHRGYIVAAPTTKEGLTGQRDPELLYCNWFTVFGPRGEPISEKGSALVRSGLKTFCRLQGVHKAESLAYVSKSNGRAENAS